MNLVNEFQYPNGWYMRVGQIYSSPYEPYHVRIKKIDYMNEEDQFIFYIKLNPKNYNEYYYSEENEEYNTASAYSWWFNEGAWDLEKEPDNLWIRFENGNEINIIKAENAIRGKQSEQIQYYIGVDLSKGGTS